MRKFVLFICIAYALLFAGLWIATYTDTTMDNMSRSMSFGFLGLGLAFTALFAVPAFIMAFMDKALKWALGLSLVPAIAAIVGQGFL